MFKEKTNMKKIMGNSVTARLRAGKSLPPVEKARNYLRFPTNSLHLWLPPAKK
jgi:hypothetical protein